MIGKIQTAVRTAAQHAEYDETTTLGYALHAASGALTAMAVYKLMTMMDTEEFERIAKRAVDEGVHEELLAMLAGDEMAMLAGDEMLTDERLADEETAAEFEEAFGEAFEEAVDEEFGEASLDDITAMDPEEMDESVEEAFDEAFEEAIAEALGDDVEVQSFGSGIDRVDVSGDDEETMGAEEAMDD